MPQNQDEGDRAMIKVSGDATLKVRYEVELDITEDEFDALPANKQDELIDAAVDWQEACRNATLDTVEIYDLVEIKSSGSL